MLIVVAAAAGPRRRPVAVYPFPTARLLWIGAHPDDELLVAPLLAELCGRSSTCHMLVLTRGENGPCTGRVNCADLGAVREEEMRASAAYLRSSLTQWLLPDVLEEVEARWAAARGSRALLLADIRALIERENPSAIVTLDPQHGSTCHPAHRATAAIVQEVLREMRDPAPAFAVQTRLRMQADRFEFTTEWPASMQIDATRGWTAIVDAAALHVSQFSPAALEALQTVPPPQRRIGLAPLSIRDPAIAECP